MLAYFKNYKIYSYLISFIVPLVVIGIVFLVTGINPMTGVSGGIIFLVLMIALMYITGRLFGKKADEESERMLALYNQNCDPAAFREQAKVPARNIYEESYAGATTELGAWFLAPFALACADMGEIQDAEMMETALMKGLHEDLAATERAGILINVEPLTLRLHGADQALSLAYQAQALLEQDMSDDANAKKRFLDFEIPLLQAMIDGDASELLARFVSVMKSESNPMRMRVLDADAAASIYAAMGDTAAQRESLQFVVDHGNGLPVVQPARVALAKLQ